MSLIKLSTKEYPVSVEEFKRRFPDTSSPKPAYDEKTQIVKEIAPVLTHKGTYEQRWEVDKKV